ncbi:uncharacterized protein LOC111335954 [Stylophora pistillata]|nr:uncharacterized protein LOC111335954 [Stylophora pistillata]
MQIIRYLMELKKRRPRELFIDLTDDAPVEVMVQGEDAKLLYEQALKEGYVKVYRARILFIGQDRAGKTSLKKSLLGMPFEPKEQRTDGIEIDPSKFEIEVNRVKNWYSTRESAGEATLPEISAISRMVAEILYDSSVGEENVDSNPTLEEVRCRNESGKELKVECEAESENSFFKKQLEEDEHNPAKTDMSSPIGSLVGSDDSAKDDSQHSADLMIDTASVAVDVKNRAARCLKEMFRKGLKPENDRNERESELSVEMWDFAGQHVYYASHPVFFSPRAIYILVHNLSKSIDAIAQPCARQGTHKVILENPNMETNLENLLSWLATLHSIKSPAEEIPTDLPYLRPPVFIVGSHADIPYEDTKTVTSKIQQGMAGKEYEKHVIRPFFNVDNTQSSKSNSKSSRSILWRIKNMFSNPQGKHEAGDDSDGDGIPALQTRILEVIEQEPYMGEQVPVRWFNFEKVIEALVTTSVYYTKVKTLQTYAKELCFVEDEKQFNTMLNFYHNLGVVVRHRDTVILKSQWLIDVLKQLITIPHFDKADPVGSKYWKELEISGVLSMNLVDHVFSKFDKHDVIKEDILDLMEQFGLIAKFSPNLANATYFVPAQLKSSPEGLLKLEPSGTDPCSLYLHFVDGFVPHGLFPQLVSRFTAWCPKTGCTQLPNLYNNGARFFIGRHVIYDLILICQRRFIKIFLRSITQVEAVSMSQSAEMARAVREFLEDTMEDLSQVLTYLRGMQYELCVLCPNCLQGGQQCANHTQTSCTHHDCFHLLKVKRDEPLFCTKSIPAAVLTINGIERWFSVNTGKDLSSIRGDTAQIAQFQDPGKCGKTLKVMLLASEWNSSKGGLSTINRHLAILLASHAEVKVTLLVPKSACGEEDKRAAESYNVTIHKADSRPGFDDPLDWLSFPPRDITTDIVLGHGAKLGKQAQVIRESHNCKWVQVVHTAPEELGIFKKYSKAISKGEEKTTAEVDLCKLADAVVAVGPKLTGAFSSYLRSCEKHQDIIELTPGIFNDFSDVKQVQDESDKFKVLTFGRGDPEDFSLKGYDIAAKAVAELNDKSYCLVFVGALDGKQEEVAKALLDSGISENQLFVRRFVKSKAKLKDLFCEVGLCIMPSRTEGYGLTALEALSAYLPILVSGNSGFGDALRVLPLGVSFVVDSSEPEEWAKAIAKVRQKKRAVRLEETRMLRKCYEEKYSWEKSCQTLVQKMWSMVYG